MTTKILVTGASGFVGQHLLDRLFEYEDIKINVVQFTDVSFPEAMVKKIDTIHPTSDFFGESDKWYEDICRDIDLIFHLAWYVEPGNFLLSSKNLDCLIGTLRFAKAAAQARVRKFLGIGTCFEYDLDEGVLSTNTSLKPLSPYAAAKAATYFSLNQFFLHNETAFTWCRLFYLFGEGEDERRLHPYVHSRLSAGEIVELTSGEQIRDYMNVSDAAEMIAKAGMTSVVGVVNVCSGKPISIRSLVENIADQYGKRDLLRFGVRTDNYTDPPKVVGVRTELD